MLQCTFAFLLNNRETVTIIGITFMFKVFDLVGGWRGEGRGAGARGGEGGGEGRAGEQQENYAACMGAASYNCLVLYSMRTITLSYVNDLQCATPRTVVRVSTRSDL